MSNLMLSSQSSTVFRLGVVLFAMFWISRTLPAQEGEPEAAKPTVEAQQADDIKVDPQILEPVLKPFGITSNGVREEEREAYYAILQQARDVGNRKLKRAAAAFQKKRLAEPRWQRYRTNPEEFPTFIDVFKNPMAYHGRPVTMRGHVRKLIDVAAGENDFGIDTLWEVWIYSDDSQNNPTVAVVTSIPEGIPTGQELLIDHVSVTGFFFKNYLYNAQDQARFAPMLLGERIEWSPLPPAVDPLVPMWAGVTLVIVGMTAGVGVLWKMSRSDRKSREQRMTYDNSEPNFDDVESTSPNELGFVPPSEQSTETDE